MFPTNSCPEEELPPNPPQPCAGGEPCPEVLTARCVVYDGVAVPCLGVTRGERLETVLPKILTALCSEARVVPVKVNATSTISVEGDGTEASPLILDAKLSDEKGNMLQVRSKGLFAGPTRDSALDLLRLIQNDNELRTLFCEIMATCSVPAVNQPPSVNAGADQTIQLPTSSLTLSGTAVDADGAVVSSNWVITSGPAGATLSDPSGLSTTLSGLSQGTYVLTLTATDNQGLSASDAMTVTVLAQASCQTPTGLAVSIS
jgi:hypothetical protein